MTQGIFLSGRRPKSKQEIRLWCLHPSFDPYSVVIEATSVFGNEFDGSLAKALASQPPVHGPFTFVGPDPYTSRKFYGTIHYNSISNKWVVK